MITWKDDTWYQGDFLGNLRHGKGLYVDSRRQRSYTGGWHCGTKHGQGLIHYSKSFKNSYDGEWIHVRYVNIYAHVLYPKGLAEVFNNVLSFRTPKDERW